MVPYDGDRFEPPAPVAYVTLRDPQIGAAFEDVTMLIDTGADVTLLPQTVVQQLGVEPLSEQRYALAGFDGSTSFAEVVRLDLFFLNKRVRGQFLLLDQSIGMLGRSILNQVPCSVRRSALGVG